MRHLTPMQEAFCLAYVETGNASEAYRIAYPRSKSWKNNAVWNRASEMLKHGLVVGRIAELRSSSAESAKMTLETHLLDLQRLRDKADRSGKFSAAVAAEVSRGRAAGFYVERMNVNHSFSDLSDDDIRAELAALNVKAS